MQFVIYFYIIEQEFLVTSLDIKLKYYRTHDGIEGKKEIPVEEKKMKLERKPPTVFPKPPEIFLDEDEDDDAAYERRIKLMQREKKRPTPDNHVISELMEKTYIYRRRQILEAPVLVADLLKTYPFLCHFDQV